MINWENQTDTEEFISSYLYFLRTLDDMATNIYNIQLSNDSRFEIDRFEIKDNIFKIKGYSCYFYGAEEIYNKETLEFPVEYLWDEDYQYTEEIRVHQEDLKRMKQQVIKSDEERKQKRNERYQQFLKLKQEFEVE